MLKRWCSIKEIERSLPCMRNFDFKRYTPRPKKLLRASFNNPGGGFRNLKFDLLYNYIYIYRGGKRLKWD